MNFDAILAQAEEKDKKLKLSFEDDWRWKQLLDLNCAYFVQNQLLKLQDVKDEYLRLKDAIDGLKYNVEFKSFSENHLREIQHEFLKEKWRKSKYEIVSYLIDRLNEWLSVYVRLETQEYDYDNFAGEDGIVPFLSAYFKEGDIRNAENAGYNKFKKEVYELLRLDNSGRYNYCEIKKNYFKRSNFVYYDEYPITRIDGHEKLAWDSRRSVYKLLLALFCFDRDYFVRDKDLSFFYGDTHYLEYVPIKNFDLNEHMKKIKSIHFYKNTNLKITFIDEATLHEFCNWLRDHHS